MTTCPKPNFTAWFVMQGIIAAMKHPECSDPSNNATLALCQPLSKEACRTRFVSRIIYNLPYRLQYRIGELVTNPGRLRHFYFRKKEVEKQVRRLLDGGAATQVVVLGAGLDVLCLRLAREYQAVKFIEIDTQESQRFKIAAFHTHKVPLPDNLEFLEGDLQNPLSDILGSSRHHDSTARTLWVAEGFFMFIPEASVIRIFEAAKQLSANGSHMLFTSLPHKRITSAVGHAIQTVYLMKEKSPFQWEIPFESVPSFTKRMGYEMAWQMDCDALHKGYMGQKFNGNHRFAENIHIATT